MNCAFGDDGDGDARAFGSPFFKRRRAAGVADAGRWLLTKRSKYDLNLIRMVKTGMEPSEGARERVLRVGLDLFSSKGFEGTGLRELATAAGVNHSLVLYHFGSMEGVWKAVVGELLDEYQRRVRERLAGLSALDPVTRLKVTIEDFIRFSMEKPELHRIMTLEAR